MATRPRSTPPAPAAPKQRGFFARLIHMGLIAGAILGFGLACAVGFAFSSLPEFSELRTRQSLGQVIRVRGADGQVVLSLGPIYGEWLDYRSIPGVMVDAMIAVEDRRFRYHPGIDPIGMARAVQVRLERGHFAQGASTITQQLAKNLFLSSEQNYLRKGQELIITGLLELTLSKQRLFEIYLNSVEWGEGIFGIGAASQRYYATSPAALDRDQAAALASALPAPKCFDKQQYCRRGSIHYASRQEFILEYMDRVALAPTPKSGTGK